MERKTKEIELFGQTVILAERNASDAVSLMQQVIDIKNDDFSLQYAVNLKILESGLKLNTRWWWLNRKFHYKYLATHLTPRQIGDLAVQVLRLEGVLDGDLKKKETANQFQEKLSDV